MDNTKMVVRTDFSVVDYVNLVDNIASEFFDDNGEYVPHFGKLNAMRMFYNKCVLESKFELAHDFTDALEMDVLVSDTEFIDSFNSAIKGDGLVKLDFANAYAEALNIVNTRKGTFGNVVNVIEGSIQKIASIINPVLGEENIAKFKQLADSFTSGQLKADNIVEAFKEE